jgi:hypothetical protein
MSVAAQLTIGRSRWTKLDQPGGAAGFKRCDNDAGDLRLLMPSWFSPILYRQ